MERDGKDRQRKLFQISVAIWYFAAGADRSLIIPTVNEYLVDYLGSPQVYMGVVISVFAIGSILCAPTVGRFSDKIGTSRPFLIFGVCCHLLGAIMYFMAPTFAQFTGSGRPELWISVARFVAGIGYGLDGAVMGTLTRAADPDNRSTVIARTILMRQVGVILGPLSIFGLRKINLELTIRNTTIIVNKYNSPGFFLMFVWSIVLIVVLLMYHDKGIRAPMPEKYAKNEEKTDEKDINIYKMRQIKEIKMTKIPHLFKREQIVVCLCGSFSGMFLQSSLETVFTPLSKRLLGFTSVENSVTYVGIGVVAVAGYFSMSVMSKKLEDRKALLAGMGVEFVNTLVLLVVIPTCTFRALHLYILMGVVVFFQCFFMACLVVSSASMLSKFTPLSLQSSVQGIRIGVETLATILAPLWIAPSLNFSIFATFSIPTVILLIGFTITLLSYDIMEPTCIEPFKPDNESLKSFKELNDNDNNNLEENTFLTSQLRLNNTG